jgi:8-oxo-dGTP diphosphatase
MKGSVVPEQHFVRGVALSGGAQLLAAADAAQGPAAADAAQGTSTVATSASGRAAERPRDGRASLQGRSLRATVVDRSFQLAYKLAYRMMRAYWGVRRPSTHGALVTLWHAGKVLLVQNSYVPYRSLPGGYVGRNETGPEAAVRELREEIGISAGIDQLEKVFDEVKDWEGKRDHVEIFALELEQRPEIRIDHREVVAADWFTPEQALELQLFPPIRTILEQRLRARASA